MRLNKSKLILIAKILFILYLAGVLVLCLCNISSTPNIPSDIWGIPADKVAHFMMFLPYPFLLYGAFHGRINKPYGHIRMLLAILISGAVFAGFIELAQSWTGYRSCEGMDLLADVLGLFTSTFILVIASEVYHKW